jgi:pilus assembly protein Flp/PilA
VVGLRSLSSRLHSLDVNPKAILKQDQGAMMPRILNFIRDDSGVTAIEYALMASLIAMAIAVSVGLLGQAVASLFSKVVDNWPSLG